MKLLFRRHPAPLYMGSAMPFLAAAARVSRRLGHDYIGTEHLLLALAEGRDATVARTLAELRVSPPLIELDILTLIGVGEAPRGRLDADALATLGIDLDQVLRQVERTFGPGALERTAAGCTPICPRLKRAFELAAREAGDSPIRPEHVLVAVASVQGSVAAEILAGRGITADDLQASLARRSPTT
jgi:ATP-dependent Clp protease ATP-binding subunit ClpA